MKIKIEIETKPDAVNPEISRTSLTTEAFNAINAALIAVNGRADRFTVNWPEDVAHLAMRAERQLLANNVVASELAGGPYATPIKTPPSRHRSI